MTKLPKIGDYVLATKYADGDPGDHFCVGFYNGSYNCGIETRHLVVDSNGQNFRNNGFRRVARVSARRGTWIARHLDFIEDMMNCASVWRWWSAPWAVLQSVDH
jgi:hypothetical protein